MSTLALPNYGLHRRVAVTLLGAALSTLLLVGVIVPAGEHLSTYVHNVLTPKITFPTTTGISE